MRYRGLGERKVDRLPEERGQPGLVHALHLDQAIRHRPLLLVKLQLKRKDAAVARTFQPAEDFGVFRDPKVESSHRLIATQQLLLRTELVAPAQRLPGP